MLLVPTIIERVATRKDNTISITLACNELSPSDVGVIMSMHNKCCYTALKPENFTKMELDMIKDLKVTDDIGKTPSQRLRGVMYRTFEQNNEGFTSFESYYTNKMETIITHLKSKLDQ